MPIDRPCSSATRTDGRCAKDAVGSRNGTDECGNVDVIIEHMDARGQCNDGTSVKQGSHATDTQSNSTDVLPIATPTTLLSASVVSSPCNAMSTSSHWSSESSREALLPSTLHTVVYYQNRFVTIDGATDCPVTTAPIIRLSQRSQSVLPDLPDIDSIELDMTESNGRNPLKGRTVVKLAQSVLSTLTRMLQDKRMTSGDLHLSPSKEHESNSPVLRKILNIIFVSTGVILLLAVVVVIVYTTVGECFQ